MRHSTKPTVGRPDIKVNPLFAADQNIANTIASMFASGKIAMVQNDRSFQFLAVNAVKEKFKFTSISYPTGPKSVGWGAVCSGHCGTAQSKY